MKVLVVGAGAIGGYVGLRLALAGHTLTLVGRQRLLDAAQARGLHLLDPQREWVVDDCNVVTSLTDAFANGQQFDVALLAVKTYDTHAAIDELRPYADRVDWIWSLQNGVSSETLLGAAFGRAKIIAGTILNPVSIPEAGVVVLEKLKGGIGLSHVDKSGRCAVEWLASELRQAGFKVRTYMDYRSMKWSKLLLNLIGNASSAILDLTTIQTFGDKRIFTIEIAALREAIHVAHAEGVRFVDLPGYPVRLFVTAVRILPTTILQPILKPLAAGGRGNKMPSLHADLANGRQRSEIDELNGVVIRNATRLKLVTPANSILVETFEDLQTGQVARSEWRHRVEKLWTAYRDKVGEANRVTSP